MAHKEKSEKTGKNGRVKAVAYLRTSSAANVGADKDWRSASAKRSPPTPKLQSLRLPPMTGFMIRP